MRQFTLVVLLAFLGFVAGGRIGASQVPDDGAFAGGATVFLWGSGGALLFLVIGIVLARRLSVRTQRVAILVAAGFVLLALLWMGSRIAYSSSISLPGVTDTYAAKSHCEGAFGDHSDSGEAESEGVITRAEGGWHLDSESEIASR
jgi:hypothetical protein